MFGSSNYDSWMIMIIFIDDLLVFLGYQNPWWKCLWKNHGDVLMGFGHCVDNLTKSCCTVPAMFPKEEDIVREVISKT